MPVHCGGIVIYLSSSICRVLSLYNLNCLSYNFQYGGVHSALCSFHGTVPHCIDSYLFRVWAVWFRKCCYHFLECCTIIRHRRISWRRFYVCRMFYVRSISSARSVNSSCSRSSSRRGCDMLRSGLQCCSTEEELISVLDVCLLVEAGCNSTVKHHQYHVTATSACSRSGQAIQTMDRGCKQIWPVDCFWLRH